MRLKANPIRRAIPSVLLVKVRSLENKLYYIKLKQAKQWEMRDCCVFIFIETWLQDNIADVAIQLDRLTSFRTNKDVSLSGTKCLCLCGNVNRDWCTNATVATRHCFPLIKVLTAKCRPFYLPREHSCVMVVAVYRLPSANANQALAKLYKTVSKLQTAHSDAFFIIADAFNYAYPKSVL